MTRLTGSISSEWRRLLPVGAATVALVAVLVIAGATLLGGPRAEPSGSPAAGSPGAVASPSPSSPSPTATPAPTPSPAASPSLAPSASPPVDLVGRLRGASFGCSILRDAHGQAWEIAWPAGYRVEIDEADDLPRLIDVSGQVIARSGDWLGLTGERPSGAGSRCQVGEVFAASSLVFVETRLPPPDGPLSMVRALPARTVELGDEPFHFDDMRSLDVGAPDFVRWLPLDIDTLALNAWDGRTMSAWIAELDTGRLRRLPVDGRIDAVDGTGRLLLLIEPSASGADLRLVDPVGSVAAEGFVYAAVENVADIRAVILGDGSVGYAGGHTIGRWDPSSGAVTRWDTPVDTNVTNLLAIGQNVVAAGFDGDAFIFDPSSGAQIGPSWRPDEPWTMAAAPDGRRFVTTVDSAQPRGRLEVRDALTGEVLATNRGQLLSTVTDVAWPTGDAIIVMRAPTGTGVSADPELYRVSDFGAQPSAIDPFVDGHEQLLATGAMLVAVGRFGEVVLATADQGEPAAVSLRPLGAPASIGRPGSWCYRSACADAGPHPARILPQLLVAAGSRLEVFLTPPHRFVRWTVAYVDAADEDGPSTTLSEGGEYNPDADEDGPTPAPLPEYGLVEFDAPPPGDWIVAFDISFQGEGDAVYYWRVTVD